MKNSYAILVLQNLRVEVGLYRRSLREMVNGALNALEKDYSTCR